MAVVALHRSTITNALDPDLPMRVLRHSGRITVYVGLWAAWWNGGDRGAPSGVKVVSATVHRALDGAQAETPTAADAPPTPLSALPWVILQLQALAPNAEEKWAEALRALQPDIDAYGHELRSDVRCPGRLTYDPSQEEHSLRRVRQEAELEAYTVERERDDDEARVTTRPVTVATRSRVAYKVSRGGSASPQAQPLTVFIERPTATAKTIGSGDSGLMPRGSLLAAVGEWRTWIVLNQ